MNLIGILIALALEYSLSHLPQWRQHHWYARFAHWLRQHIDSGAFWNSPMALLLLAVPVPLGVYLVDYFAESASPILGVAWSVVVLLLCLGPRDLFEEAHSYAQASDAGDRERLASIEDDLQCSTPQLRRPGSPEVGVVAAIPVQAHERLLGVLLWFFLLGPLGAALYRLVSELPELAEEVRAGESLQAVCRRLHDLAAWVPVRVTALAYALAGSTEEAITAWREAATGTDSRWRDRSWAVLAMVGCASIREDDEAGCAGDTRRGVEAATGMVRRSLFILLAVFALFTIGGWVA